MFVAFCKAYDGFSEDHFEPHSGIREFEDGLASDVSLRGEDGPLSYKYARKFAKMSLQCEACGPDLELYEMMRRRRRQ